MRWPKTAPPILSRMMPSGVDPLEGVLDAKPLVHILEPFAADQFPCTTIGSLETALVHAVVVEDDLHAAAATDDLVCLIVLPGNYLKVHSYFQINQKSFR